MSRVPTPVFPTPGPEYDQENESQFRRMVLQVLEYLAYQAEAGETEPWPGSVTGTAALSLTKTKFTIAGSGTIEVTGTAALSVAMSKFTISGSGTVSAPGQPQAPSFLTIEGIANL